MGVCGEVSEIGVCCNFSTPAVTVIGPYVNSPEVNVVWVTLLADVDLPLLMVSCPRLAVQKASADPVILQSCIWVTVTV